MNRMFLFAFLMLSVAVTPVFAQPSEPAPTPTEPANEVTSLFSNAYTDQPVDTWSADWDMADVEDVQIQGNDTKLYTNLTFAGIEFTSNTLDVSDHSHFHMDIWTPDATASPAVFAIKLVDFGADGLYGGGDDSESEIPFNEFSDPPLVTESWIEFDIPMSDFSALTNLTNMAQLVISGDPNTVYVDNIYFYGTGGSVLPEPTVAAPTPTEPADEVVSLFSNAYDDVTVDTWSAGWDNANVEDVQIAGDDAKKYTGLVFAGIEFTSNPVDASDKAYFHMDIWTPDDTGAPAVFKIKLVDFGADGLFGGGDDSESELTFSATSDPPLVSESWISFHIPLTDFAGLTNLSSMAQLVISGDPNTVYVDNIYFSDSFMSVSEPNADPSRPLEFATVNVYPNPFNPATTVALTLPYAADVQVAVYNGLGRQVATLAQGRYAAGTHSLAFDGSTLASGVYLVRATVDQQPLAMRKMLLLK